MPDPTTAREAVRDGIASALASVHLGHPDTGPCMQCTIRLNEVMPAVEAAIDEARGQVVEVEMGAHGDCARCGTGTTDSHGDHVSEDLLTHITDWRHRAEHAEASLEQLRRALDAAERAGVAAVDLNQMLRTELRVTANRLAHIPVPETAADARRQVRLAAEYLRTLAGLSAVAVAERARASDAPLTEMPVQVADVATVLRALERRDAAGGNEDLAAALERLGRAVRTAEGEDEYPAEQTPN